MKIVEVTLHLEDLRTVVIRADDWSGNMSEFLQKNRLKRVEVTLEEKVDTTRKTVIDERV